METEILKILCANHGAVDTEFLVCNLGYSASEIISSSDKFVPCCPFGQPRVVARTEVRLCRTRDCPGSCRGLHLCKSFLLSGSCQFNLTRRGCRFPHTLDTPHNGQILRTHRLEHLSREELCMLLLQSDNRLLPQICHDYNIGDGVFGRCQKGLDCKRLHVCERHLNLDCTCWRNHTFCVPHTLSLLQGIPPDLSLKSVYANIQALKYHDIQSNRAKTGNRLRGNKGNRRRGGRWRGHAKKVTAAANAKADSKRLGDWDSELEDTTDDEQQPAEGAFAASEMGSDSFEELFQLAMPWSESPPPHQQASEGGVATPQQLPQACSAVDSGARQQLQGAHNTPTSPLIQGACATGVVPDAANAGPRPIQPQKTSAATHEGCDNAGTRQLLQGASATAGTTAAASDVGAKNNSSSSPQLPVERSPKAHDRMPYRWEINLNGRWSPLSDNEAIEKDFCDPKKTCSGFPRIQFDTMTKGSNKVRRAAAGNSLQEPGSSLATQWLWYWEDEFGMWNLYASPGGGHRPADVDSSFLEQKFLADADDVVLFKAHSQQYCLSFKDMIQQNVIFGTKKLVRRRPRFVSTADVPEDRQSKPGGQAGFAAIPNHWDKSQLPQTGYQRVPLISSSEEYKEVEALFHKTMRGFHIVKIERIQNKTLWDFYQLQKTQMKNSNRGHPVLEMKLFHGTDNQYVHTICHTNFDWRLCGTNGTVYGKGSYFALDAKYSHHYTSDSDVKSMFVVRLLVGEYTRGSSDYRRPPSKDGGDVNFYDSCVDDVLKPSIYVVFDKHQIYPEYLLQYQKNGAGSSSIPSVRSLGISQSSPSYQPSKLTLPLQQPTILLSNTAATSIKSNQPKSPEKSCIIS